MRIMKLLSIPFILGIIILGCTEGETKNNTSKKPGKPTNNAEFRLTKIWSAPLSKYSFSFYGERQIAIPELDCRAVKDNILYIAGRGGSGLFAIDSKTGKKVKTAPGSPRDNMRIWTLKDKYITCDNKSWYSSGFQFSNKIQCFEYTNKLKWSHGTKMTCYKVSCDNLNVYAADHRGSFYALNQINGKVLVSGLALNQFLKEIPPLSFKKEAIPEITLYPYSIVNSDKRVLIACEARYECTVKESDIPNKFKGKYTSSTPKPGFKKLRYAQASVLFSINKNNFSKVEWTVELNGQVCSGDSTSIIEKDGVISFLTGAYKGSKIITIAGSTGKIIKSQRFPESTSSALKINNKLIIHSRSLSDKKDSSNNIELRLYEIVSNKCIWQVKGVVSEVWGSRFGKRTAVIMKNYLIMDFALSGRLESHQRPLKGKDPSKEPKSYTIFFDLKTGKRIHQVANKTILGATDNYIILKDDKNLTGYQIEYK